MKKTIILFAVIMITLTAASQTKISKIKVFGLVTTDQYDRTTEEEVDGRMGIDLDNQIIYTYYEDGNTIVHHYIVDRVYTCEDNYVNLEGIAVNAGSRKKVYINIASHNEENLIIITMSDTKNSMSFIGKFY